jgi:predicted nucleic acid-binding protein
MILLDSDVMIDILRNYPPAMEWFDALDENEEIALPGYVLMELIQGCRNKAEQDRLQRAVSIPMELCGSLRRPATGGSMFSQITI